MASVADASSRCAHAAPIAMLSHLTSFLGDVKNLVDRDSSDSAICMRACALRRSTKMYNKLVANGLVPGFGNKANSGSRRGA